MALSVPGPMYGVNFVSDYHWWGSAYSYEFYRDRLDYAKAIGANLVRLWGDVTSVFNGDVTLATYLARYEAVATYAKSIGMYLYPTLVDSQYVVDPTNEASWRNTAKSTVQMIEASSFADHVIGYDLVNEPSFSGFSVAKVASLYSDAKTYTSKSCSVGAPMQTVGYASSYSSFPYIAYCDHIDVHMYVVDPASNDLSLFSSLYPTKDLLVGEWGLALSAGSTARTIRANAVYLAKDNSSTCKGVTSWHLFDYDTNPSNMWGLFTSAIPAASYSDLGLPFRKNRGGDASIAAPTSIGVRHADGLITWTAMPSTDYVGDRLYKNGTQVFDDIFCLYPDSSIICQQVRLQASARNSSTETTTEFIWPGRLPPKLLRRRVQATFR